MVQISLIIDLLYNVTLCLSKYPVVFIAQNTVCKCKINWSMHHIHVIPKWVMVPALSIGLRGWSWIKKKKAC